MTKKQTIEKVTLKEPSSEKEKPELTKQEQQSIKVIEHIIENRDIVSHDAFGKLNRTQVELIKRTYAKGASDDELKLFITACHGLQLSPFSKHVHLVPRWDSREGQEVRAIQVGIDGLRATAEKTGKYAGNDDPIHEGELEIPYTKFENKKPVESKLTVPAKSTVTVYKIVEGQRYGFTATARWEEYYPGPKQGFQWHIRPFMMLGKCAEALALRKAFPSLLSGIYTPDEMDRGTSEASEGEKLQKARNHVSESIAKANLKELEDLRKLIVKSTKYEDAQKAEFLKMVDEKIKELKSQQNPPATPVDTVQVD